MGLNRVEIRFKADCRQTAEAWQVQAPLRLQVLRPTAVQALADARRVIELLRGEAAGAEFPDARLAPPDPETDSGQETSQFFIEQKSSREVRLQINFQVTLTLEGGGTFWAHAAAIAAFNDFLQAFSLRPHDKGVEVDILPARVLKKGATPAESEAVDPG